jgi:hypothetical protein
MPATTAGIVVPAAVENAVAAGTAPTPAVVLGDPNPPPEVVVAGTAPVPATAEGLAVALVPVS